MQVGILGPLVVLEDGRAADIGGSRLRALLIRLALDAGRVVTTDALASALWPDDGPADPVNAVQTLVSRLRRALPRGEALLPGPGGYRLDLPPDAVDAVRFERLARAGRLALRGGEPGLAARQLREALTLWRGEALADIAAAPFAAAAAVRLGELRLAATEDRLEADLQSLDERSDLVAELRELTVAHPLRERLRHLLLRALVAEGRSAEALATYEEFRRLLADELGASPGPELQRAHLALLRGEEIGPRTTGGARPRGTLRAALTSFVGRGEERARIAAQLGERRLVTLVGPGGAGKTRLATTVAADAANDLAGGAWLVELGHVTDRDAVIGAAAAALGLRETSLPDAAAASNEPVQRLVEALSTAETLVVLDSWARHLEPLLHPAARRSCSMTRLATRSSCSTPRGPKASCRLPEPPNARQSSLGGTVVAHKLDKTLPEPIRGKMD